MPVAKDSILAGAEPVEEIPTPVFEKPATRSSEVPFVPVSDEDLATFLNDHPDWPVEIKVKMVDIIQRNNAGGVKAYAIGFIPGIRIKIDNGRIVTSHV